MTTIPYIENHSDHGEKIINFISNTTTELSNMKGSEIFGEAFSQTLTSALFLLASDNKDTHNFEDIAKIIEDDNYRKKIYKNICMEANMSKKYKDKEYTNVLDFLKNVKKFKDEQHFLNIVETANNYLASLSAISKKSLSMVLPIFMEIKEERAL